MSRKHWKNRFPFEISWGNFHREVFGLLSLTAGCVTFLALLYVTRGTLSDWWANFLRQSFGWGAYLVPLGMVFGGLFLLRRNLDGPIQARWETLVGLEIIAVLSLVVMHFLAVPEAPIEMPPPGEGGGKAGWAISLLLLDSLGLTMTLMLLFLGMISGLILTFSIPPGKLWDCLKAMSASLAAFYSQIQALMQIPARPEEAFFHPSARVKDAPPRPIKLRINRPHQDAGATKVAKRENPLLPPLDLLDEISPKTFSEKEALRRARLIEETLESFGVPAKVVEINQGPVVTQFGVEPGYIERRGKEGEKKLVRVRVSKINALANDLALALAAAPIRIEAPVPGRPIVGIEVPNAEPALVSLREVLDSAPFQRMKSKLKIALGRDVAGQPVVADLATMPHLLIAGATGSGKSVCINSIVCCLLYNNSPQELRLLMIDPKMVELTAYNSIPHLLAPVVIEVEQVVGALTWITREMDGRYRLFSAAKVRNIEEYNRKNKKELLPYIIIVIDELADLMMAAPEDVEWGICRIAQMARATGIHLIIATQRPSVDVVTGLIKANFSARISFAVTSQVDSRVILDTNGAETLLGRGDMLYMPPDSSKLIRLQGCFVSDAEIARLVNFWRKEKGEEVPSLAKERYPWLGLMHGEEKDELLEEAIALVRRHGRASASFLQRRLRIGYPRAARLIDLMEEEGIITPASDGEHFRGRD